MWNDGLKSYNGSAAFTYDAIGNPLTYNNGSAYTFTWQNGRQLASATKGSTTYTYTYNSDGLRTRKTVGSTVYNYYWQGSQLVAMTLENSSGVVTSTYKFYYDSNGLPFIFDYNGTIYYYVTNLQGDVVGLADEYGISARYTYDAWGKIISTNSASNAPYYALMANPLRYRGYIYDNETGFYYLQSRYYDPEVGRFINADGQLNGGLLGNNLYAYCENNPVMYRDDTGKSFTVAAIIFIAVGTIIGAATGAYVAVCDEDSTTADIVESTIEGALTGGVASTIGVYASSAILGLFIGIGSGAIIDSLVHVVSHGIQNQNFDEFSLDIERTIEVGITTGLSAAVPTLEEVKKVVIDSVSSAIIASEASVLIAITTVIYHIFND